MEYINIYFAHQLSKLYQNIKQRIYMDHYQKKEQDYTKWNQEIWLSVEKQISQFQIKVTDCMLALGDFKKRKVEDYSVEPCLDGDVILGEQFYTENIRPECVKKGYLSKKVPTPQDLSSNEDSDDSDEDQEQEKVEKKEKPQKNAKYQKETKKKGGKKGSKNNKQGKSNQEQMKMKIVQQNFKKDIQMVLDSHSLERLQIQFGLKHKKLEVKLITFFYVVFYIRKNKQSKKIEESEIFQLINILIKIVRIFDGFQGQSFLGADKNKNETIEVSPTLLLDLKLCIKGLKQFYKYSNRKIIINYPKLVYYTSYDRFFPTLDIKPYPSQIQFIQTVKKAFNDKGAIANPTLVLYRTMIGSGKTSASLALSNLIVESKMVDQKNNSLQLIYSCLIGSVRVQVGRYAYNKRQKFALAAMEKSLKNNDFYYPRIINSYSCKNQKIVDLIISDLDCTYEMLNHHADTPEERQLYEHDVKARRKNINVGKLDRENIVLFIDEPTAFCKSVDSEATQRLFKILANYPPKLTILASATMPDASQLSNTIKLIEQRNPGLQVFQVESKEFQIGCQFCSFKGQVIFPHTGVKSKKQLDNIIKLLDKNPFLLRLYTGPSLFFLLKRCEDAGIKGLPKIDELPEVKQGDIIKATFRILKILKKEEDKIIEEVCCLATDQTNLDYKIQDQGGSDSDDQYFSSLQGKKKQQEEDQKQKQKQNFVDFKLMVKKDAFKFLGGCLIGTENPLEFARQLFDRWVRKIKPVKRLIEKYRKHAQDLEKQIRLINDDKQMREEKKIKQISKLQSQKQATIQFPEKKRINTVDHYKRYCKDKQPTHLSMLIKPVPLQSVGEELLDEVQDFVLKLLFCGVALYMEKGLSPKYLDKVQELASQNYLAYIITDQSLCYGTNFPISNVILRDDLAVKLNMNEIFQLIGRAGRVGQSWTARAFLQPKGLAKLNDYIHNEDKAISLQADIFEKLASQHLNNPQLTFRSTASQIRYVDIVNPDERIQIQIRKKKQDSHLFNNVVLVPFAKDGRILCHKLPYQSLNYYQFPQSQIFYEDIPTITNNQGQQIIDVSLYYKKQPQFIKQLLNNTVSRIIQTNQLKIQKQNQLNQFKPKVYEQFFNSKTKTFIVMFKVDQKSQANNYKLHKLENNTDNTKVMDMDDVLKDKLKDLVFKCTQLCPLIYKNPTGVLAADVSAINKLHQQLMQQNRIRTKFYRDIINAHYQQNAQKYEKIIDKVSEKNAIQCRKQSIIALIVQDNADIVNVNELRYQIDWKARDLWNVIKMEIQQ